MKKLLLILVVFTALQSNKAQTLTEGSPALVYALPKTELNFMVIVEKVVEKPGVFYLYSQRYLATDKVITEEKTSYQVKSIRMLNRPIPDLTRRYSYLPSDKSVLKYLVVNEQGLLCGVNIPSEKKATDVRRFIPSPKELNPTPTILINNDILPLTQEYMMAGSTAKLAEGAAKQIYDLRASRISLLTGEMDQLPKDGEALRMMLAGLDRQEKILSELFVGSRNTEITTHNLIITPEAAMQDEIFFRISEKRGLVDKDDMGGAPYFITITPEDIRVQPSNKRASNVGLYTILPAQTSIKITDGVKTLLERSILMPQFGALVPLPENLFKSQKVSVKVDVATGRLLSIEE